MIERDVLGYQEPYYDEEEQCKNCQYFNGKDLCELFKKINTECSDLFALQEKVSPKGYCKAFEAEEVKDMKSLNKMKDKKIQEEMED